jgi:S-adenosyl methyltransferase
MPEQAGSQPAGPSAGGGMAQLDTRHAHPAHLVISHPASDIRPEQMAEMTRRVNQRMSGPVATMRDRAAVARFFDGFDLLPPGVVQPQQWRPEPEALSPPQVTAWCGVARKR